MKNLTKKIVYLTLYAFLFVFYAAPCFALDESALADQVAKDISEKAYSLSVNTVAFWKLTNHDKLYLDASKFQDKLDIDLLHSKSVTAE